MPGKEGKIINKYSEWLKLIAQIFAVGGLILGAVLFPTHKRIEGLEKEIKKIEEGNQENKAKIEKELNSKVSQEILSLQLNPVKEDINEIKADLKALLRLWREKNGH